MIANKVIIQLGSSKRRSVTINGDLILLTTNSGPIKADKLIKFEIFNTYVTIHSIAVIYLKNNTIPILYRGVCINGGIILAIRNISEKCIYNKLKFEISIYNSVEEGVNK